MLPAIRPLLLIAACALPFGVQADAMLSWGNQIGSVRSALKITTKQKQVSSDKATIVRSQSTQAYASTAVDIYNREQVLRTVDDFGVTGQLVDPCYQVSMANTVHNTIGKASDAAQRAMERLYRIGDDGEMNSGGVSGAFGGTTQVSTHPYAAETSQRTERHLHRYCSVSEAAAGYCTLNANGMQSADSDFSLHVVSGKTFGWDQSEAATDFVKTVAPVKPMPKRGKCRTPDCMAAMAARRLQEAYVSMSRFSMVRFVESRTTQASGDAKKPGSK